jgi:hypothetical protein
VLTAMIIMPPYRNILLYGIESFIHVCSLCLNNEIIIEIKLILLLKKSEENKWVIGGKQIVYFLIKEMVALDGKLSNRYFSLNTLKV